MPRISCVVATRDRDEYIKEMADSIIAQTESDWELIIVDDHSKPDDKTEETIKAINDLRIKYYRLNDQNGMGIACARNFGNEVASSEIIAVMDSDDICYPTRFELTLEAFSEKVDVVYGDYDYFYDKIEGPLQTYKSQAFNLKNFKRYDFIVHASAAYLRQISIDFPYNSFFRRAEDYDLFSRLHNFGYKFKYIPASLIKVRKHSGSITISKDDVFEYPELVRKNRNWR